MSEEGIIRIVLTGPESTAKSTLARQLAAYFKTEYIPEYAREHIENLNRPYEYDDIVQIASTQIVELMQHEAKAKDILFIDTWLIITKIWFQEIYNNYPEFIDDNLNTIDIDLYLLCFPDMDWEPDPVRENRDKRLYLFGKYEQEIIKTGTPYEIIKGLGESRLANAINAVTKHFGKHIGAE